MIYTWANCLGLTAAGLVEVHVDALQLQVRVPVVGASGVHAMLITDDLPELGTNLVAALSTCRKFRDPTIILSFGCSVMPRLHVIKA